MEWELTDPQNPGDNWMLFDNLEIVAVGLPLPPLGGLDIRPLQDVGVELEWPIDFGWGTRFSTPKMVVNGLRTFPGCRCCRFPIKPQPVTAIRVPMKSDSIGSEDSLITLSKDRSSTTIFRSEPISSLNVNIQICISQTVRTVIVLGALGVARAQDSPAPDRPTEPAFEQVSEHVYRMGDIVLNKKERTVRFPAKINMRKNTVEYFCVTETGRTHESVLSTKISPAKLHIAMLLIGRPGEIKPPMSIEESEIQKGYPVGISVRWTNKDGEIETATASKWIVHTKRQKALPDDFWEYTSSRMREDVFLAERDGSVAAIMGDVNSIINIRDEDRKFDDVWVANTEFVPEIDTPVEMILTLQSVDEPKTNPSAKSGDKADASVLRNNVPTQIKKDGSTNTESDVEGRL